MREQTPTVNRPDALSLESGSMPAVRNAELRGRPGRGLSEAEEHHRYGARPSELEDDAEPLPYSRDEVWVFDDFRLGPDGQIDPRFVTPPRRNAGAAMVTVNGDRRVTQLQPGAPRE